MLGMLRHEHISSNSSRWLQGFSFSSPEKGCAQTMAIKQWWSSPPDERFGGGSGLANSPFEAKGFFIRVVFMFEKGKRNIFVFIKGKRYRYEDELGSKKIATVLRQRHQKCLLVFLNANRNNLQAHGITIVAFHPKVFRVSYFPQRTVVLS